MPELQPLRADHAQAVLAFETQNRAWFTGFVSDRGDTWFAEFADRHRALVEAQEQGSGAFYVLVDGDREVVGRFNLELVGDGVAHLGYRVAQRVAGRGVATATVRDLCRLAADRHGVRVVRAAASTRNVASQRVLAKAGFVRTGPADPSEIGGNDGSWWALDLGARPEKRSPGSAGPP